MSDTDIFITSDEADMLERSELSRQTNEACYGGGPELTAVALAMFEVARQIMMLRHVVERIEMTGLPQ